MIGACACPRDDAEDCMRVRSGIDRDDWERLGDTEGCECGCHYPQDDDDAPATPEVP